MKAYFVQYKKNTKCQNLSNFSLSIFCFTVPLKSHLHYSIFRVIVCHSSSLKIFLFNHSSQNSNMHELRETMAFAFSVTTDLEWWKWDLRAAAEGNNDLIFSHFPTQNCHLASEDLHKSQMLHIYSTFMMFLCHFLSSHSLLLYGLSMIIFQNFSFLFF